MVGIWQLMSMAARRSKFVTNLGSADCGFGWHQNIRKSVGDGLIRVGLRTIRGVICIRITFSSDTGEVTT